MTKIYIGSKVCPRCYRTKRPWCRSVLLQNKCQDYLDYFSRMEKEGILVKKKINKNAWRGRVGKAADR